MKRQLSSKQTFPLKIILPIFFTAVLRIPILMLLFSFRAGEFIPLIITFPLLLAFGVLAMRLTVMKYKKVSIDEEFLYVSNYRKEITISLSKVADVTEFKWVRTRPITIHLKQDSEFGRKIIFTPKLAGFRIFAANPVVAELKNLAKINAEE